MASKVDVRCETERFGSDYGGWEVVTKDINANSIVYSFGVGEDASFDLELIKKFGLKVYAFDPTPKSIEWVEKTGLPREFIMNQYGIANFNGEASFDPPSNRSHVSYRIKYQEQETAGSITLPVKKLDTIMKEFNHGNIDILKIDIEGAEYCVIEYLMGTKIRPSQVLIEFHDRFEGYSLADTLLAIKRLKKMGYNLFYCSSSKEEFGFILQ